MGNLIIHMKVGQRIQVGEAIITYVKDKSGNFILLGIEAPENVKVNRKFYFSDKNSDAGLKPVGEK